MPKLRFKLSLTTNQSELDSKLQRLLFDLRNNRLRYPSYLVKKMNFVSKKRASEILSKSSRTLVRYRQQGILIEGIHCAFVGNEWLYNEELIKDLITCGMNPNHPDHQRAIAYYQSQKLGNQLKTRQKKYQAV